MATNETEIKKMFDNAMHIGHRTRKWNPRMRSFIYGERDGVHIIDLEKSLTYLLSAIDFVSDCFKEGKTVLFVSTKPQSKQLIKETAEKCKMPYVSSKWIPGLLTNFPTIKSRIKYLLSLKDQEETGELSKYTKKEAAKIKKEIVKLETALGGVVDLDKEPDVVFVLDPVRDEIVVKEAKKIGIPVVAIVDTNADPSVIDYPIPGNDDAVKSLNFVLDKVKEVAGSK